MNLSSKDFKKAKESRNMFALFRKLKMKNVSSTRIEKWRAVKEDNSDKTEVFAETNLSDESCQLKSTPN